LIEMEYPVIEHGATRPGLWLRERRLRLAIWIAIVEGLLIVFDVIPGWTALAVGAVLVAFYVFVAREGRSDSVRQASWVAATSQVLVALVPVAAFLLTAVAIVVLVVLALGALALLLADRR
jgi:hypothetical protein